MRHFLTIPKVDRSSPQDLNLLKLFENIPSVVYMSPDDSKASNFFTKRNSSLSKRESSVYVVYEDSSIKKS